MDLSEKIFAGIVAVVVIGFAVLLTAVIKQDNRLTQQCHDKGGIVVKGVDTHICINKSTVINVE